MLSSREGTSEVRGVLVSAPVLNRLDGSIYADFSSLHVAVQRSSPGDKSTIIVTPSGPVFDLSLVRFASAAYNVLVAENRPLLDLVVAHPECPLAMRSAASCEIVADDGKPVGMTERIASPTERHINSAAVPADLRSVPSVTEIFGGYDVVVVGGTFDRLHAGHRLLLTAAAWAAKRRLWIGVTAAELLAHKAHAELMEPFCQRADAARQFAKRVRPDLQQIDVAELHDAAGPAAHNPTINAMVVSYETLPSAKTINDVRQSRGLSPMTLITVDVLNGGSMKLSSSALRKAEIENRN